MESVGSRRDVHFFINIVGKGLFIKLRDLVQERVAYVCIVTVVRSVDR